MIRSVCAMLVIAVHLTSPPINAQNVAPLFAPPTAAELDLVEAEWALRSNASIGWTVEAIQPGTPRQLVVSHLVDGDRHYAYVRYPANFVPGGSYPILLANHGGFSGVDVDVFIGAGVDPFLPGLCIEDDFFTVVASYGGEPLNVGPALGGPYLSEGGLDLWDTDVDDVSSLLTGLLENIPQTNGRQVVAFGASRGGGVSLLLGARDDRISAVVDMFGHCDFTLAYMRQEAQALANGGNPLAAKPATNYIFNNIISPWLGGTLPTDEARLALIRRSAAFFVKRLPRTQAHHGTADNLSDVRQTLRLAGAMSDYGQPAACAQTFLYPGGQHTFQSLVGSGPLAEALLCGVTTGAYGYVESYGSGCSGTGGATPKLGVRGCLDGGALVNYEIANGRPMAEAVLISGTGRGPMVIPGFCDILVDTLVAISPAFSLNANGRAEFIASIPVGLPPGFGSLQALVVDPLALGGVAMSAGVEVATP